GAGPVRPRTRLCPGVATDSQRGDALNQGESRLRRLGARRVQAAGPLAPIAAVTLLSRPGVAARLPTRREAWPPRPLVLPALTCWFTVWAVPAYSCCAG